MADQIPVQTEQPWKPAANPWLIAAGVMLATFMEVLDSSVANVSLTHIAGNLSASSDEATWVLTSYLVSNAVILSTSSWLSRRFGRRRFLITCITIFTIASMLCGLANSLGFLILARIIQGAGGGALQPVSQAVMLETFPPEKRGAAMSVYAMGVIVAPILGPTLGVAYGRLFLALGFLHQYSGWHCGDLDVSPVSRGSSVLEERAGREI